jgi:GT2 family glycosyltransferase
MTHRLNCLNVGCGHRPSGDVNVDLYVGRTIHRDNQQAINPKNISNFIIADALHLPFKTNAFDIVETHHVIEHIDNPTLFLQECIRVAKKQVLIVCPHAWARSKLFQIGQGKEHKNYFRPKWFYVALQDFYSDIKETRKPLFGIPFLTWFSEIQVTIYLNKKRIQWQFAKKGSLNEYGITAIIPVKQGTEPLIECVRSLRSQTVQIAEILVVQDENLGQEYARVKGALKASSRFLLFVDSDIIAKKDALEKLLKQDSDLAVARMIPLACNKFSDKNWKLYCPDITIINGKLEVCGLHFTLIKRCLFLKFRNRLHSLPGYAGDVFLSQLLREHGYKLSFVEPSVYHYIDTTPYAFFKKRIKCGYALAKIEKTEGRYCRRLILLFWDLLKNIVKPWFIPYRFGTLLGFIKGVACK